MPLIQQQRLLRYGAISQHQYLRWHTISFSPDGATLKHRQHFHLFLRIKYRSSPFDGGDQGKRLPLPTLALRVKLFPYGRPLQPFLYLLRGGSLTWV